VDTGENLCDVANDMRRARDDALARLIREQKLVRGLRKRLSEVLTQRRAENQAQERERVKLEVDQTVETILNGDDGVRSS
jgi:hypothetical protein